MKVKRLTELTDWKSDSAGCSLWALGLICGCRQRTHCTAQTQTKTSANMCHCSNINCINNNSMVTSQPTQVMPTTGAVNVILLCNIVNWINEQRLYQATSKICIHKRCQLCELYMCSSILPGPGVKSLPTWMRIINEKLRKLLFLQQSAIEKCDITS